MDEIINLLFSFGKQVTFPKNEFILKAGSISNKVYYIKEGVVRHFVIDRQGNEKTIRLSKEQNFFYSSIVSFFKQEPSYIYCQALTDAALMYWDNVTMQRLFQENPGLMEFRNQQLINFIIQKHDKEISLLTKDASTRFEEFNQKHAELYNRIPHHIIASFLGISPETLSRLRTRIKT